MPSLGRLFASGPAVETLQNGSEAYRCYGAQSVERTENQLDVGAALGERSGGNIPAQREGAYRDEAEELVHVSPSRWAVLLWSQDAKDFALSDSPIFETQSTGHVMRRHQMGS